MATNLTWIQRAALAFVHQLASDELGYHPDTAEDNYNPPLDAADIALLWMIHQYLQASGIEIADEVVDQGRFIIVKEQSPGDLKIVSDVIYDRLVARQLMLDIRDEFCFGGHAEPNEGRATVLEGENDLITATDEHGTSYSWRVLRIGTVGQVLPHESN